MKVGLASYHQAQNRFRQKFQNFISEFVYYNFRQFWHVLQIYFKLHKVSSQEIHFVSVYDCDKLFSFQFACFHYFLIISSAPSVTVFRKQTKLPTLSLSSSNQLSMASANCYLPSCAVHSRSLPGGTLISVCACSH